VLQFDEREEIFREDNTTTLVSLMMTRDVGVIAAILAILTLYYTPH
jgi:hypothetical protein